MLGLTSRTMANLRQAAGKRIQFARGTTTVAARLDGVRGSVADAFRWWRLLKLVLLDNCARQDGAVRAIESLSESLIRLLKTRPRCNDDAPSAAPPAAAPSGAAPSVSPSADEAIIEDSEGRGQASEQVRWWWDRWYGAWWRGGWWRGRWWRIVVTPRSGFQQTNERFQKWFYGPNRPVLPSTVVQQNQFEQTPSTKSISDTTTNTIKSRSNSSSAASELDALTSGLAQVSHRSGC